MASEQKPTTHGGARPGAGRKPNSAREELPRLLDNAIPLADRTAILVALAEAAKDGDIKAATLVLAYLYGRPIERQEVTGDAQGPLKVVVEFEDIAPASEDV